MSNESEHVMDTIDETVDHRIKANTFWGKIYIKIMESCRSPWAVPILAILSFTESCIFIIPPEILMLPMSYAKREKTFFYVGVTTVASVLGAIAGYYIGAFLWDGFFQEVAFEYIPGFAKHFDHVGELYRENAVSALFIAAFTPIPFKVFTVVAGVYHTKITIGLLIGVSIIGRGLRYFILGLLVYIFGAKAEELIEKHFRTFTLIVGVAVILLVVLLKLRH